MAHHKFEPETTNGGNVFCDCSCGWSGGVFVSQTFARKAWVEHGHGQNKVEVGKVNPVFQWGNL